MLLNKKQSNFVQQHLHVKRCWTKSTQLLIRWPKNRFNRFCDFSRMNRIIRIDKIFKSIFWNFWKPYHIYGVSFFRIFDKVKRQNMHAWVGAWHYHRNSNNKLYKHETPIKPLDDASSICETWYTWIWFEFLMYLLTDFCDGTTFHHLWDHKILSKRDDWILHVSEFWFEK